MSLKSIRSDVAAELGYHPDTNSDDLVYLNNQINKVCKDFHVKQDLIGSMFELIAFWDQDAKLVSFPPYVGEIRGAHYYDSPLEITLRDIRPRYATGHYGIQLKDFRKVGVSTLAIQEDNYSVLTFSLPEGETEAVDINITLVGESPVASNVEEVVTIPAGSEEASSVNTWVGAPRIMRKEAANNFDIEITDAEDTLLAIIPNNALDSRYTIWQVRDDKMVGQLSSNSIEVLYKNRFYPLVNDGDEFLNGEYDEAIFWKIIAEAWTKMEGKETQVENANVLWVGKISDSNYHEDKGKKAEVQSVPNRFYSLFDRSYWPSRYRI